MSISQSSEPSAGDPLVADCPGREIFNHLTSRWGLLVLLALTDGPLRFFELRDRIGGVSEKMLAQTLRTLTRDGLLLRTVRQTIPPQVSYALSPLGDEIAPVLHEIRAWLGRRIDQLSAARRAFDERGGA